MMNLKVSGPYLWCPLELTGCMCRRAISAACGDIARALNASTPQLWPRTWRRDLPRRLPQGHGWRPSPGSAPLLSIAFVRVNRPCTGPSSQRAAPSLAPSTLAPGPLGDAIPSRGGSPSRPQGPAPLRSGQSDGLDRVQLRPLSCRPQTRNRVPVLQHACQKEREGSQAWQGARSRSRLVEARPSSLTPAIQPRTQQMTGRSTFSHHWPSPGGSLRFGRSPLCGPVGLARGLDRAQSPLPRAFLLFLLALLATPHAH
jgi:hypothetical protein